MAGSMFFTFCVALAAMLALASALYRLELAGKRLDARLKRLREAARVTTEREVRRRRVPVVFVVVLVYLVIMALKLQRLQRELGGARRAGARAPAASRCAEPASGLRRSSTAGGRRVRRRRRLPGPAAGRDVGRAARLARADCAAERAGGAGGRLSVGRLGGLAQPLRLARRRRLSLWGCRPRYRLLGLAVMPLAVVLLVIARLGGGTGAEERSGYSNVSWSLHVGLCSPPSRLHARRRAVGALPVAGAAAEEPPAASCSAERRRSSPSRR